MKNLYLPALFLFGTLSLNAQNIQHTEALKSTFNKNTGKATNPTTSEKAVGTIVWSDNFSSAANWTFSNAGTQGDWIITSTTPADIVQYWGAMASSTAANGFGVFNGVQYLVAGTVDPQDARLTVASNISTTGFPSVKIEFEQRYRAFNTDETWVEFSTDNGLTWNGIQLNTDVVTNTPAVQNTISVDVSSLIGNQANVLMRFRWINTSDDNQFGSGYGWMVDDVKIVTPPDYDLSMSYDYWGSVGLHYYQIPLTQVAPIDFANGIFNEGGLALTNLQLNVDVNTGAFTGTSPSLASLAPGARDTLELSTPFTPSALGTYTVTRTLTMTETDDVPVNNVIANNVFDVTNFIYARDNGVADSYNDNTTGAGAGPFEVGNLFDVFADQNVYGINYRISTGTPTGSQVYGRLYVINASGDFEYVTDSETDYTNVTTGMLGSVQTLLFYNPIPLTNGATYLAVVGATDGAIRVSNAGFSDDQTSFLYAANNDTWYYTNQTPMVRLNFDPSLSINENAELTGVKVYPNPSTGIVNVTNDSNIENTITVLDLTGKVVATKVASTSTTIDLSNVGTGIYLVEVSNANGKKVERVAIK